jgi:hypothetical protein
LTTDIFELHPEGARAGHVFVAQVYDEHMAERPAHFTEQAITGQQLLETLGFQDVAGVILLQQVQTGDLVEVRLREVIDLALPDNHRFFAMTGDRTYRFTVDEKQMEWGRQHITAATLAALARAHGEVEIVQEIASGGDKILEGEERANLGVAGVERFKVRHVSKEVLVEYNHEPRVLPRGVYTTEELMARFNVDQGYVLDVMRGEEFVVLVLGEHIRVHSGQKFFSHAPCGHSS